MKMTVNGAGTRNCAARISAGDVDMESAWSFSAADGNALLGSSGGDWASYAKWFMGLDSSQPDDVKARYHYPFGKGGKVYRSALVAIRQRAAQQNEDAIFAAAGEYLAAIDKKSSIFGGFDLAPAGLKHMVVPVEIKEVTPEGSVSGYASIFGNVDLGGDVVVKDEPFKEIVTDSDGKVLHLFQHDASGRTPSGGLPIGLAEIDQNSKGLKFKSQLVMDDPFVQRVHKHLKARTLRGMSIGYDILPGGARMLESGARELSALKLWEISSVTFPMNPRASVESVKTIERCRSIRELEDWLRDAVGLSKSRATLHASAIWKDLTGRRDADEDLGESAQRLIEYLNSISKPNPTR